MIDPKKELFRWGPIDGRPIYIDPFVQAFVSYPDFINNSWPDTIGYFKQDKVLFILEDKELKDNAEELFKEHILNKPLDKPFNKWLKITENIVHFETVVNKGLKDRSDKELIQLFSDFEKAHIDFWHHGFLPELSNWGGERLLKEQILKFNKLNFIKIFERLSAPEKLSFFQKEEIELLNIKLAKKEEQKEFLKDHQNKYYWLRNSYCHTKVLDQKFFEDELKNISEEDASKKIKEIKEFTEKIKLEKKKIIKKYKIDKETTEIADKLAFCIYWQDFRKQFIFIANHIVTCFIEEISKRKDIPFKDLCYYCSAEIVDLMKNNNTINTKERINSFLMYYHERKNIEYFEGEEANNLIKPFLNTNIDPNTKEFSGTVVSIGKIVKGNAKILLSPKNAGKLKQGDILIAPMTSPDFIIAMKKASAIITDEGGMTSHAAIVSRELGIPCIVGTRIATKVLKDNDVIEVDTKKGLIRKLN